MEKLEEKLNQVRNACARRIECRDLMDFLKLAIFVIDYSEEDDFGIDFSFDYRLALASEILDLAKCTAWDLGQDSVFFYAVVLYARTLVWMGRSDLLVKELEELGKVGERIRGFEWVLQEVQDLKAGLSLGKWVFEFDTLEWAGVGVECWDRDRDKDREGFRSSLGGGEFENIMEKIVKK